MDKWESLYHIYVPHKQDIVNSEHMKIKQDVFCLVDNYTKGVWSQEMLDYRATYKANVISRLWLNGEIKS